MMISTAQFSDSFLIPHPNPGYGTLQSVGNRYIVAFQFTTPGRLPYQAEFQEACGAILGSALPAGYVLNNVSTWSPTWVVYNAEVGWGSVCARQAEDVSVFAGPLVCHSTGVRWELDERVLVRSQPDVNVRVGPRA